MSGAAGTTVLPPDRVGSPGSLIVSFAGSYLREIGGWIAVAHLIRCLDAVQVTEPSVRQALVRLKSRGFLVAERRGADAGYRLTDAGLHDLATGDRRIFRHQQADLQDGWVLAVFSVPETDRHLRHRLRSELNRLGFGTVGNGVWIAPRMLADRSRSALAGAGLDHYVTWFAADNLTEIDVGQWWDLESLRSQYETFLAGYREQLLQTGSASSRQTPDDQAFAHYLRLIDDWRLFPRLDPGLPESLVPPDWPAHQAWELFDTLHNKWAAAGLRFVRSVVGMPTTDDAARSRPASGVEQHQPEDQDHDKGEKPDVPDDEAFGKTKRWDDIRQ